MKKKIVIPVCIAAAVIIAVGITLFFVLQPRLTLKEGFTLEAGSIFNPLKVIEKVENADTDDVEVTHEVDTAVPGEYEVKYTLNGKEYTAVIEIVDTTAPVMTIHTKEVTVPYEEDYGEASIRSYAAIDVEDVQEVKIEFALPDPITVGTHTVKVTATDPSGNSAEDEITVHIVEPDLEPPVISGTGSVAIIVGTAFDPLSGVTVTDNTDSSPKLTVDSSALDVNKIGTYTVVYTAEDKSGNIGIVRRTVTVRSKPYIYTSAGGATWDATGIDGQPYFVAVNRALCTVTVYGKDENGNYTVPVKAFPCSVGRSGHSTPTGQFRTLDRYRWCLMVDGTWGQYAIRVKGGIMFHSVPYFSANTNDLEYLEYNKLGSPASLGCIRLSVKDVKWLYDNCPFSFGTVIYDDTTSPGPLGKPSSIYIDPESENRGWDPTDPDPNNPW